MTDRGTEPGPGAPPDAARPAPPPEPAEADEAQRLIRAGLEVIRDHGTMEPRVSDIVRRAGLSNKAFYRHFRSKEDLLAAVLQEGMRYRMEEFAQRLARSESAVDRIREWVRLVVEQAVDTEIAAVTRPLLVFQGRILESMGDLYVRHTDTLKAPLLAALREARENGELPHARPEADADAIYYLSMGWMHGKIIYGAHPTREEAEAIVDFALRSLGAASARG